MAIQEIRVQQTDLIQVVAQNRPEKQSMNQENISIHNLKEHIPMLGEKTILDTIEQANKKLEGVDRELKFSIHEKTKQIMVKVIQVSTKEVIREIPPEKILDMVLTMCENAGLFVDEKI